MARYLAVKRIMSLDHLRYSRHLCNECLRLCYFCTHFIGRIGVDEHICYCSLISNYYVELPSISYLFRSLIRKVGGYYLPIIRLQLNDVTKNDFGLSCQECVNLTLRYRQAAAELASYQISHNILVNTVPHFINLAKKFQRKTYCSHCRHFDTEYQSKWIIFIPASFLKRISYN